MYMEIEKQKSKDILDKIGYNVNLAQLHKIYKENLYIEDTDRIDAVLAAALSSKLPGISIWLIIVGPSGDLKSVQLNAIRGEDVFVLHNLTSKTLVNGHRNKINFPDLAPELDGKIVIIPDMAQILKLPAVEKGELWGQLRDLYDGLAGKVSGMGSRAQYENLKVTLLAGSTPAIDGQILVHQDLGTRELVYRTSGNKNKEKVMKKCFENEEYEEKINKELKEVTTKFLSQKKITRKDIPKEVLDELMKIAIYTSNMRATAEFDSYTSELRNFVYPEEPTRLSKQLKRYYICLKNLDKNYKDSDALRILWHIGKSSAFPLRIKIFEYLLEKDEEISTSKIAEDLEMGKKTIFRECNILQSIGLVKCKWEETNYPDKFYYYWKIVKDKAKTFNPSPYVVHNDKNNKGIYSIISGDGLQRNLVEKDQIPGLQEAFDG